MAEAQQAASSDDEEELSDDERSLLGIINAIRAITLLAESGEDDDAYHPAQAKSATTEWPRALAMAHVRGMLAAYRSREQPAVEELLTELLGLDVRADSQGLVYHILCGEDTKLARLIAKASNSSLFNWTSPDSNAGPRDYTGEAVVVYLDIRELAVG